jgi:hypothetical protein
MDSLRAWSSPQSAISIMTASATQHAVPQAAIYTCPMHRQIRQSVPGSCSICGMALEPAAPANTLKPLAIGTIAFLAMLGIYFGVLTLVSGWDFTVSEFTRFWYYVLSLALGFSIQMGLYVYLRQRLAYHHTGGEMVVASGATSTGAMLACCAHYLTNILPVIGAAGAVTLIAQYQVELFWVGLASIWLASSLSAVGSSAQGDLHETIETICDRHCGHCFSSECRAVGDGTNSQGTGVCGG